MDLQIKIKAKSAAGKLTVQVLKHDVPTRIKHLTNKDKIDMAKVLKFVHDNINKEING